MGWLTSGNKKARKAGRHLRPVGVRNQKRDELLFVAPVIRWGEPLCHEERRVVPGPTRRVNAGIVSACGL